MQHKRPPIPVIILVLAAIAVAVRFVYQQSLEPENGALAASGTIEAIDVKVSPEIGGKVAEVLVNEGDRVQAGEVLFRLDDTLLQAQRDLAAAALGSARAAAVTAEAGLATAKAQFELVLFAAQSEAQPLRANAWRVAGPAEFEQPGWFFSPDEQLATAREEVVAAQAGLDSAMAALESARSSAGGAEFIATEARVASAREAFLVAREVRERVRQPGGSQELSDAAQSVYDSALDELESAQEAFDAALTTETAQDLLEARADLAIAREQLDSVRDRLRSLQTGELSPRVEAALRSVDQAAAAARQGAQAVTQAEASLALIEAQIAKLAVLAPVDAVVLTRSIQPGEVIAAGADAITLTRLDDLTITVYVPEERYGEVSLGQEADVSVDSFPGETFSAAVVRIADRAEFTPRNVQTVEGRKTTVYAVRLKLDDPGGKLKPGMPADVTFK